MLIPVDIKTLQQMNDYVAATQPVLQKAASVQEKSAEFANKAVDTLIKQGFLNENLRSRKVAAYIEDPLRAMIDLQTVAANSAPPSLGGPGNEKAAGFHDGSADERSDDAFGRIVMGGRPG